MSESIAVFPLYRRTFLRHHIQQHVRSRLRTSGETGFGWDGRQGAFDPAGDILALVELRQSIYQTWLKSRRGTDATENECRRFRQRLVRLTRPEEFFYSYSELVLYRSVQIGEYRHSDSYTVPRRPADLTSLIRLLDKPTPPPQPENGKSNWLEEDDDKSSSEGDSVDGGGSTRKAPGPPPPDMSHIVLTTRTGAGKTVACWKAFYDCLFPDPSRSPEEPLLKDYVPCWLRSPSGRLVDEKLARAFPELQSGGETAVSLVASLAHVRIPYLLALAAGLIADDSDGAQVRYAIGRVRKYLTYGPKLLLFIDLNHVATEARPGLVRSIAEFHSPTSSLDPALSWQRHRLVIAYRTTLAGTDTLDSDDTLRQICQPDIAKRFDLEPLKEDVAVNYLRNVRNFEKSLYEKLREAFTPEEFPLLPVWRDSHLPERAAGLPRSQQATFDPLDQPDQERWVSLVTAECELLRQLIRRTESNRESLISTPLLMHWVASLPAGRLPFVENVTHLYHEVVYEYLSRHESQSDRGVIAPIKLFRALTGLTRVALLMLAGDLRLRRAVVLDILDRPVPAETLSTFGVTDKFWREQPQEEDASSQRSAISYYSASFSQNEATALLGTGLLREVSGQIGFLHDSLVYYFAGVLGLHHYRGPHVAVDAGPLAKEWSEHAARRMTLDPSRWAVAAEFLGGSLVPMRGLSSPFKKCHVELPSETGERRVIPEHRRATLHDLLHHLLLATPHQGLPGLFLRLLRGFGNDDQDLVVKALRLALIRRGRIETFAPIPKDVQSPKRDDDESPLRHVEAFPAEQLAQDCFNFLYWIEKDPGPCHEFACRLLEPLRATGRRWLRQIHGPRPSLVQSIRLHHGRVTGLACLSDNRIVSAGEDRRIYLWDPNSGRVDMLVKANSGVNNLLIDADDGIVYTSGSSLYRWNPADQTSVAMISTSSRKAQVVLGPSRRTVFVLTEDDNVIGLDLSWRPEKVFDPRNPPQVDLQWRLDVDELIPFRLPDEAGEQSCGKHLDEVPIDEVAIIDKDAGRILRWSGGATEPTDLYQVSDETLRISEVAFDQHDALLVHLAVKEEYSFAGIWRVPLRKNESGPPIQLADIEPRMSPRERCSITKLAFPDAPGMVVTRKTKRDGQEIETLDVLRWDRSTKMWEKRIGFDAVFEPIGVSPRGEVLLKYSSDLPRRGETDPIRTTHLRMFNIESDQEFHATSHLDRVTAWAFEVSGAIVVADTFGFVKRALHDRTFRAEHPLLRRVQKGLVVDHQGNVAWCGNDCRVRVWFPMFDEEYELKPLDSAPIGLAEGPDATFFALDHSGKLWACRADSESPLFVRDCSRKYSGRCESFAISPTGAIGWTTDGSAITDGDVYRGNVSDAAADSVDKGIGHHRLAIDPHGNMLIIGGIGSKSVRYWPIDRDKPHPVDLSVDNASWITPSNSGHWFFAKGERPFHFSESELVRWSFEKPDVTETVVVHKKLIGPVATSKDGAIVVSGEADSSLSREHNHGHRTRREDSLRVFRSTRDHRTGQWRSEELFEFRSEVSSLALTATNDVLAASIDGTLQFAGLSGEKLRIETGQFIEWMVADPNRPVIAMAAHEQGLTVFAIEPDVGEHENDTLTPYRRNGRLDYLVKQLERQLEINAPASRVERLLRAIADPEHDNVGKWSADRILAALLLDAPLRERFPVLMQIQGAFQVVENDATRASLFTQRLIQQLGYETESELSQKIRFTAFDACVSLGGVMVDPLLTAANDRSWRYLGNVLMVLQNLAPTDTRVDTLMDAFLIDGLQPKTVSALSQTAREARLQTRRFLIERLYSLVDQFSDRHASRYSDGCFLD